MINEAPNFCPRCGVPIAEGHLSHGEPQQCIDALRLGLKRQAQAAENLAFEVSTRYFGILEGLAHDPEVAGVGFYTHNADTGELLKLPGQIVCGVMTAILREYQKAGNWSPLDDAKKQAREAGHSAYDLLMVLKLLVEDETFRIGRSDLLKRAEDTIEAALQLGVHLRGPGRS